MQGGRSLFVVEPGTAPADAFRLITERAEPGAAVYYPHGSKQSLLQKLVEESGIDLPIVPMATIYGKDSDDLYGYSWEISQKLAPHAIARKLRESFSTFLTDRLTAILRPADFLITAFQGLGFEEMVWVSAHPRRRPLLWDLLQRSFSEKLRPLGDSAPGPPLARPPAGRARARSGWVFAEEEIALAMARRSAKQRLCFCANFNAAQYAEMILPLIEAALADYDVLLVSSTPLLPASPGSAFLARLSHAVERGRLTVVDRRASCAAPSSDLERPGPLRRAGRALEEGGSDYPVLKARYHDLIRETALQQASQVASQCLALWPQAKALMQWADATVVCPGRPLACNLLVAAAARSRKPSFELQSGPISRSRRTVPPTAAEVFAIDGESRETYRFLGRKDGVLVIGSLRLDERLRPFRGVTKPEARQQLGLTGAARLWTIATQPILPQTMSALVALVLEAASRLPGTSVLIKLHPYESVRHEAAYRALLTRFPDQSIQIDRQASSILAAIAADCVFTSYSTVGLEAFALGRTVVAVNTTGAPLPYDLARLGVAYGADSVEAILAAAERPPPVSPDNAVLLDSGTLARCLEQLRRRLAERRAAREAPALSPGRPGP